MGKANKVKSELQDAVEMVNLIQTLKDIADNKYFTLSAQKYKFKRFGETFSEFFRMLSLTTVEHPMIKNDVSKVGIVVVTIEGSFLGRFNNSIIRKALAEKENHEDVEFIAVGDKSIDQLSPFTPGLKQFSDMGNVGIYETALALKDYLVDQVMSGKLGKVIIVYAWPKSFDIQRYTALKLLPCDEIVSKQAATVKNFEKVIEESDPVDVIGVLSRLWLTTKIYEILMETTIASAAAQSSFLDDSLDKMKKERVKTKMRYLKAKKGDIDKSLRETFSARMMTLKGK